MTVLHEQRKGKGTERLLLFPIVGLLSGIAALSIDMYLPAFPAIADDLNASAGDIQLTLGFFLAGLALGQLIHGTLSDRYGRKPVILIGLILYALASLACALSVSTFEMYFARFVQGLCAASGVVLARAVIRDIYQGDALAKAMSWLLLVMTVIPMLAPMLGSLVESAFGWQAIFKSLMLFALIWFGLIYFFVPETLDSHNRQLGKATNPFHALGQIFQHKKAIGYSLCGALAYGGMFAYISGTPFIYMTLYGVDGATYALLFALNILSMSLGSFINIRFVASVGRELMIRYLTRILLLASTLLLLASITGFGELYGLVVPLFIYMGCLAALAANCIAGMMEFFPEKAGSASSVFGLLQFGLGSLGAVLVSQFQSLSSIPMATIIMLLASSSFIAYRAMCFPAVDEFMTRK